MLVVLCVYGCVCAFFYLFYIQRLLPIISLDGVSSVFVAPFHSIPINEGYCL